MRGREQLDERNYLANDNAKLDFEFSWPDIGVTAPVPFLQVHNM